MREETVLIHPQERDQTKAAPLKLVQLGHDGSLDTRIIQSNHVSTDLKPSLVNPYGGNIGIGTTAPTQKLSVAGVIESTSGGVKFPDGTTQTTAAGAAVSGTANMSADSNPPYGMGWVDLSGLSATLAAGTYLITANLVTTVFCDPNEHGSGCTYDLRLYNSTDSVALTNGTYSFKSTGSSYTNMWSYTTVVTISGTKLIKFQANGNAMGRNIYYLAVGSKWTYVKIN